jgi:hypothetical protein
MANGSRPIALKSQLDNIWDDIDELQNSGGSGGPHIHPISDVTGLQTALNGKQALGDYAASDHGHAVVDVAGLQAELDGKQVAGNYSLASHDHDAEYALIGHDHSGVYQPAGSYAAASHSHVIADVTGLQAAIDGKQAAGNYAATNHNHNGVYQPAGSYAAEVHEHLIAEVTGLQAALDGKQASGSYLTSITSGNVTTALGYTPSSVTGLTGVQSVAAFKTGLSLVKADVGLGSVDNTADAAKAVLTATKFAVARNINGVAFDGSGNITINAVDSTARVAEARTITTTAPITGGGDLSANRTFAISAASGAAAGSMSSADFTKLAGIASAATANSTDAALSAHYRTLLDSSGSLTAAKVAGTYGLGQGDPIAVSGTGTLYPLNVIYIDAADYPAIGSLTAKLRVRAIIEANDVAPTGNFTIGLHAVTRPGTSGGAGLCIYSMAAAIAGSTATVNTPAADSQNLITSADFAVPATGYYVIGLVTTGTIATSAHVHVSAALQLRYS